MKCPTLLPLVGILLCCRPAHPETPPPRDFGLIRNQSSPQAKLRSVDFDSVRWTEGFWAERYRQNREVTLRRLWELLADPEAGHVLDNMRIAAGLKMGEFAGTDWQDAWLYKWIDAAACVYRMTGDAWIEQRMDEAIELIARAQQDDGYIATQVTAQNKPRFQDPRQHEVYSMGHLLTAACVHHRMTGKDSLLNIAIRNADFLCSTLGVTVEPYFAHNPSAVMGLVELYRETGREKYLACAKLIVDKRGSNPRRHWLFEQQPGIDGTDLIQDRVPLRLSQQVVGHNVFFTYLYAGAADVYLENGDQTLREPLERLWHDLVERKMCINGGVSPMGAGLSNGHPVIEAVGPDYFLPCADSYNETCGQIGNFMWNYRMLCAEEDARYADIMELELYNGFLAGVGLDGQSWFYRNSLRRYDKHHIQSGHNDMAQRGLPGRKQICCPTNLLRTIAQLQAYLYSASDSGIWIHHYGGNKLATRLPSGEALSLEQQTGYPWSEKIAITLDKVPQRAIFIKLRIPAWAENAAVGVNGNPAGVNVTPGSYVALERKWITGDVIELTLPMPVRLMQAHPKAEQLRNQVAVMRGPVLYCLESADLPEAVDLNNVYLPSDIALEPTTADDLPFGLLTLDGSALYRAEASWEGTLYRKLISRPVETLPIRMIPYFAWANRGPSAMSAWLPVILKH